MLIRKKKRKIKLILFELKYLKINKKEDNKINSENLKNEIPTSNIEIKSEKINIYFEIEM